MLLTSIKLIYMPISVRKKRIKQKNNQQQKWTLHNLKALLNLRKNLMSLEKEWIQYLQKMQ